MSKITNDGLTRSGTGCVKGLRRRRRIYFHPGSFI